MKRDGQIKLMPWERGDCRLNKDVFLFKIEPLVSSPDAIEVDVLARLRKQLCALLELESGHFVSENWVVLHQHKLRCGSAYRDVTKVRDGSLESSRLGLQSAYIFFRNK